MTQVQFLRALRLPLAILLALVAATVTMLPVGRARLAKHRKGGETRVVFVEDGKISPTYSTASPTPTPGPTPNPVSPTTTEESPLPNAQRTSHPEAVRAASRSTEDDLDEATLSDAEIEKILRARLEISGEGLEESSADAEAWGDAVTEWSRQSAGSTGAAKYIARAAINLIRWGHSRTVPTAHVSATSPIAQETTSLETDQNASPDPSEVAAATETTSSPSAIVISNRASNGRAVAFLAGREVRTLQPGESLTLGVSQVRLKFDTGVPNKPPGQMDLTPGDYEFVVSQDGWGLSPK